MCGCGNKHNLMVNICANAHEWLSHCDCIGTLNVCVWYVSLLEAAAHGLHLNVSLMKARLQYQLHILFTVRKTIWNVENEWWTKQKINKITPCVCVRVVCVFACGYAKGKGCECARVCTCVMWMKKLSEYSSVVCMRAHTCDIFVCIRMNACTHVRHICLCMYHTCV